MHRSPPSSDRSGGFDDNEDSSMPVWLADELENADIIPIPSELQEEEDKDRKNEGSDGDDEESVPAWLAEEMDNAEYIPMHDEEEKAVAKPRSVSVRETFQAVRASSMDKCSHCLSSTPSVLELKVKELECENAQLLKRLKEQEVLIKKLEAEKECYQKFSLKLTEVTQTVPEEGEDYIDEI